MTLSYEKHALFYPCSGCEKTFIFYNRELWVISVKTRQKVEKVRFLKKNRFLGETFCEKPQNRAKQSSNLCKSFEDNSVKHEQEKPKQREYHIDTLRPKRYASTDIGFMIS